MGAPQEVPIPFFARRDLEPPDMDALRVAVPEHAADEAVLAAGVHGLEDDEEALLVLGVEPLLQPGQAPAPAAAFLLGVLGPGGARRAGGQVHGASWGCGHLTPPQGFMWVPRCKGVPHPLVGALRSALAANACPADAAGAQAYMKTDQPFYGVKTPMRRRLLREALHAHLVRSAAEYEAVVRALWNGTNREERYLALDTAERLKAYRTPDRWPLYEELLRSAGWWDTVDWIAAKLLGDLLQQDRSRTATLRAWVRDPDIWVRRAGLLVHLKHQEDTDLDAVTDAIEALQDEQSFWIRKAIGWLLRAYGATDPGGVRRFVADPPGLPPLSRRDALKRLEQP